VNSLSLSLSRETAESLRELLLLRSHGAKRDWQRRLRTPGREPSKDRTLRLGGCSLSPCSGCPGDEFMRTRTRLLAQPAVRPYKEQRKDGSSENIWNTRITGWGNVQLLTAELCRTEERLSRLSRTSAWD
jgi:hypothetical protein